MNNSKNKSRGWPPELERFPTTKDAKEATRAWSTQQLKTLSFWIGLIGYAVLAGLAVAMMWCGCAVGFRCRRVGSAELSAASSAEPAVSL